MSGKEGTKIIERSTGEVEDAKEYRTDYGTRGNRWRFLAVPVLLAMQEEMGSFKLARWSASTKGAWSGRSDLRNPSCRTHPLGLAISMLRHIGSLCV